MTDVKALCDAILKQTLKEEDKYQIGLTKIFFRAGMLALLEGLRTARLNQLVTVVQKNVRRWIEFRRYQNLRVKTIKIQCWWRVVLAKRLAEEMRREKAAVRIQAVARGWLARKQYQTLRTAVIRIQAGEIIPTYEAWPTWSLVNVQSCVVTKLESGHSKNAQLRPWSDYRACSEV